MRAHAVVLIILSTALFSFGLCQDESDTWEAKEAEIKKVLRSSKASLEEKQEALSLASEFDGEDAARYLVQLIGTKSFSPTLKKKATEILSAFTSRDALDLIKEQVNSPEKLNRHLLAAFLARRDPDSRVFLLNLVNDEKSPRIRALAVEGISQLGAEGNSAGYLEALRQWVRDKDEFHGIRRSAANALAGIPERNNIPVFIEMLGDPLLGEQSRDALLRMTGLDHWTDKEGWKDWWENDSHGFEPTILSDEAFLAKRKAMIEEYGNGIGFGGEFYGRKLEGRKIVFILDASGSMILNDRMTRLKSEMEAIIENMTDDYHFGIVCFPHMRVPGRDYAQAKERHRERSMELVSKMAAVGDTPMVAALEYTFKKVVPRNKVDTIYLLSDGVPSDLGNESLPDLVLGLNEEFGVRFHTVYISDDGDPPEVPLPPELLERIDSAKEAMRIVAEESGGTFWTVP